MSKLKVVKLFTVILFQIILFTACHSAVVEVENVEKPIVSIGEIENEEVETVTTDQQNPIDLKTESEKEKPSININATDEQIRVSDLPIRQAVVHGFDSYGATFDMEVLLKEDVGGDTPEQYFGFYDEIWYVVFSEMGQLAESKGVDVDLFREESDINTFTNFHLVVYGSLPKEEVVEALKHYIEGEDLTHEQAEFIAEGVMDKKRLAELFPSPYVMYKGENAYPIDWIAAHTWRDFDKAGISEQDIRDLCNQVVQDPGGSMFTRHLKVISGLLEKKRLMDDFKVDGIVDNRIADFKTGLTKWEPYRELYYGLDSAISELVPEDVYEKWVGQFIFSSPYFNWNASIVDCNTTYAIRELGVDRLAFEEWNSNHGVYTTSEIDALFSGNPVAINTLFVNPNALLLNGDIYTVDWLNVNDLDAIDGVTQETVDQLLNETAPSQVEFKNSLNR